MGSHWLAMMGSGYLGSNMWTLLLLVLGLASAQQQQLLSNEVGVENAGYAVDPNDPNNYYATQYANSAPGTEFYSQYPQEAVQAASDTDRITPELMPRIKRRRKNDILKKDRTLDDSSLLDSALD